jgi:hypothetical protein
MRVLLLLLSLLAGVGVAAQETPSPTTYSGPKDKLHIYLLIGQSNMSGRATVEDEDRQLPKHLFLLDDKGKWVQASHPFVQYTNVPNSADQRVMRSGGKAGLNLGLAFARAMLEANPDVAIGLIVNSQGGSTIETWRKGTKNYEKTMERVRPVKDTGLIKGILWHQGEGNQALGEKYLQPLAQVIEQFRADLNDPKLPFVAGQIAPQAKGKETIGTFNQALLKLPTLVPHTAVARTDGFKGDDVHFNSAETRKLGARYAAAMLMLQGR